MSNNKELRDALRRESAANPGITIGELCVKWGILPDDMDNNPPVVAEDHGKETPLTETPRPSRTRMKRKYREMNK